MNPENASERVYELDKETYKRFPEHMNCLFRSRLDPTFEYYQQTIRTNMKKHLASGEDGYSRFDLALNVAAWTVDMHMPFAFEWDPKLDLHEHMPLELLDQPMQDSTPEENTHYVKQAALYCGATEVGITRINKNWLYSSSARPYQNASKDNYPPIELPDDVVNAIVIGVEMDKGIKCAPTFLELASTGLAYSKMTYLIAMVAQFIRALGYTAIPSGNDVGLSIPLAIDAGLGGLGRNGLLINKNYGPRFRICKVFTNMPLVGDKPDFSFISSLNKFCSTCKMCAEACDSGAISKDDKPDGIAKCPSNNPGVIKKWYVNQDLCYKIWVEYSSDCGKCIQVCPFSKTPIQITADQFWDKK
ncbi:MAG: 4Fe-4S dicluster domain-containing protein [Promethearchaeota archaeon]